MATTVESQQLNALVRRCGGSEEGAQWLKLAVDPFHDVDLELVGFPDQTPGRSVIYNVTKNITITKPSGVTDGKFDAHVSFIPVVHTTDWVARNSVNAADGHTDSVADAALNSKEMGPGIIQVCTVPAGEATFRAGANEEYSSLDYSSLLDVDGSSISRLIGCAFEVHNTTEELHKSGAVTVYRYDNNKDPEVMFLTDGGWKSNTFTSNGIHGPPTTEANAKLLNGITWEAADGCLVPCVMDTINEPQKLQARRNHFITKGEENNIYWGQENIKNTMVMFSASAFNRVVKNAEPSMILPFMGSGAYFTGLAAQTSLTVTMRAFVEVFPSPGNALVPLAHPSSPYDGKVLQCYSEIMSELHAGYPVYDNAAGDYFRKALGALKQAVTIGQMMPATAPLAAAVSSGIQAGEEISKAVRKAKRKQRPKKPAQA